MSDANGVLDAFTAVAKDNSGVEAVMPIQATVAVAAINETPTNLAISANSINEGVEANSLIGILTSTDPDAGDTFTYRLASGGDNDAFTIVGDQLKINSSPNFDTQSSYSILVRSTDQGGLFFDKALSVGINNVITGSEGGDEIDGGDSNDAYSIDSISDVVTEHAVKGSGTDTVNLAATYAADTYSLTDTNVEKLNASLLTAAISLIGNSGKNTITGGAGDDILDGSEGGADNLIGGLGNDIYIIHNSKDKVIESSKSLTEIDTVQSSINYTLGSSLENLTLTGLASTGTGNVLDNNMVGNDGKNNLKGNAGNDTLDKNGIAVYRLI